MIEKWKPRKQKRVEDFQRDFPQSPGTVIAIALLAVLSTAGTLALPLTAAALIAAMQNGEGVVPFTLLMVGVGLGGALASALSTYLLSRVGEQLVGTVRTRFMRHTLRLLSTGSKRKGTGISPPDWVPTVSNSNPLWTSESCSFPWLW